MGTQLQGIALPFAAVKGNAVHKALKIDVSRVAVLSGAALHGDHAAVTLLELFDLAVDDLLGDLSDLLGGLQALIFFQLHLGLDGDGGLEDNAVLLAHGEDLHLRTGDGLNAGLLHGVGIALGIQAVDSLLKKDLRAIHFFNHGLGGLALTEAGDGNLFNLFPIGGIDPFVKILGGDAHLKLIGVCVSFFCRSQTHFTSSYHLVQKLPPSPALTQGRSCPPAVPIR